VTRAGQGETVSRTVVFVWRCAGVHSVHDPLDDGNFDDQGSFVGDLRVQVDCRWSVECE
jgi:hypothetical protein